MTLCNHLLILNKPLIRWNLQGSIRMIVENCISSCLPNLRYTGMLVPVIPNIIWRAMLDPHSLVHAKFHCKATLCICKMRSADPRNWTNAPIMGIGGIVLIVGLEKIHKPIEQRKVEPCNKCDQGLVGPRQ